MSRSMIKRTKQRAEDDSSFHNPLLGWRSNTSDWTKEPYSGPWSMPGGGLMGYSWQDETGKSAWIYKVDQSTAGDSLGTSKVSRDGEGHSRTLSTGSEPEESSIQAFPIQHFAVRPNSGTTIRLLH